MHGKCSKKDCRQSCCADISAPTLREVREGWDPSVLFSPVRSKAWGHPPSHRGEEVSGAIPFSDRDPYRIRGL